MKKLCLVLAMLLLLGSGPATGEWVACDPAPESDNVTTIIIINPDGSEVLKPYAVDPANHVKLIEISADSEGTYQFAFENDQGRRSDFVLFTVKLPPGGCQNLRIIN
ncbi:MAG: hypothetical protein ACYS1A_20430 [Planctomycetota bacterium]